MQKENSITKAKKALKTELGETKRVFKERVVTLILAGFGLVAALAWNEAIQAVFATYFQKGNEIIGKFIYAAIVTIVVVIVSRQLERISEKKS